MAGRTDAGVGLSDRGLSPRVTIGLLSWSGPQMVEHFAAQDQMARTTHVQWAGPEPSPLVEPSSGAVGVLDSSSAASRCP